jgi:hypothetical protein
MDKMAALCQTFLGHGMLVGTMSSYVADLMIQEDQKEILHPLDVADDEEDGDNGGPVQGDPTSTLFITNLAAICGMYNSIAVLQGMI